MSARDIQLTGNQVKAIRLALGDSQQAFADRIAVSQPAIFRLEQKGSVACSGPDVILIKQIADANGVVVPELVE